MKTRAFAMAAIGLCTLGSPASAQIIATSIPRAEAAGGTGKDVTAGEKKFALHLMAAPLSKWRYNELATGLCDFPVCAQPILDAGVFTGTPNSDFLLAAEMAFKLGENWSFGVGGWYNKVGKVTYDFDVATLGLFTGTLSQTTGTLDGDLKVSEGHASLSYKSFGIQGGIVHTSSKITSSVIKTTPFTEDIGKPLGSIEGESSSNDWDLYAVYKFSGGSKRAWGISLGAGIYRKKGSTEGTQRAAENQTVASGFVTASVDVVKGLGIDASYWYVGKTEASRGENALVTSDAASRLTLGIGFSFSK